MRSNWHGTVVTYQTSDPRDGRVDICPACARKLREHGNWPHGPVTGEEYHSVYMGLHSGVCRVHRGELAGAERR